MFNFVCKMCESEFTAEKETNLKKKIRQHHMHNHAGEIAIDEYVAKYYLNIEQVPLCKCGCGNKVALIKGLKFNTFYKDTCYINLVRKIGVPENIKLEISKKAKENNKSNMEKNGEVIYKYKNVKIDDLKDWWSIYTDEKRNVSGIELSKMFQVDFRTIKKAWISNNIASDQEISRYARLHKNTWGKEDEGNSNYKFIEDKVLELMIEYLYKCKNENTVKTISDLKINFNIEHTTAVIYKRLVEKFGKDLVNNLLNLKNQSQVEVDFGNVLTYFFGAKNVKFQFKISFRENKRKNRWRSYDYCLFNKLLVEFDGTYWHRDTQDNDLFKNKLAIKNGYYIYRVKESEAKNIEPLADIFKIVEKIKKEKKDEVQINTDQNN